MNIGNWFSLDGFTRMDLGDEGAVFIRYAEDDKDGRTPELKETTPNLWTSSFEYTIKIPKPRPRRVSGCAVVTHSSKNCYSATVFDERRIATFKESSEWRLELRCIDFFTKGATR